MTPATPSADGDSGRDPPTPSPPRDADDWEPPGVDSAGRRGFFLLGVFLGIVGCVVHRAAPDLPHGELWFGAALATIALVLGVTGIRRLARGPQWRFGALVLGMLVPIVPWSLYLLVTSLGSTA